MQTNLNMLSGSMSTADLMALAGTIALVVGGGALVMLAVPRRAKLLARRVSSVRPHLSRAGQNQIRKPTSAIMDRLPSLGKGLTAAEQRAVIRLLSFFHVPPGRAMLYFICMRIALAFSAGSLLLALARHFSSLAASGWALTLVVAVGTLAGWILPGLLVGFEVRKRTKAAAAGLPDALELLVVCIEAGLSLEDGLRRVVGELRHSQPAIADELALTWAEINLMPNRAQALGNLAARIDAPRVRSVVGMLSQSMKFGTPLVQSLRVGAAEIRNEQIVALEERASRLPALLTIPVMIFIMPTIFLIVGGPAALRLIDMFQNRLH